MSTVECHSIQVHCENSEYSIVLRGFTVLPVLQRVHRSSTETPQRLYRDTTETPQRLHRDSTETPQSLYRDSTETTQRLHRATTETSQRLYRDSTETLQRLYRDSIEATSYRLQAAGYKLQSTVTGNKHDVWGASPASFEFAAGKFVFLVQMEV